MVKLDLRRSILTSVPAEIGQLSALRVLYLDYNQLTSAGRDRAAHLATSCTSNTIS